MSSPPRVPGDRGAALADPELRRALERMIRGRARDADVEDILQATLVDAVAAASAPEAPEELRRWVFGIARHKIADHHRKASRLELRDSVPDIEADASAHSARDLARWVEAELPASSGTQKTLEWMAREADGDRLETIAAEENIPAPRVRQRVSRLRRLLRERWALSLAVTTFVVVVTGGLFAWRLRRAPVPSIAAERPMDGPIQRARRLRERALERCRSTEWHECLEGLDQARSLDPVGDAAEAIQEARSAAARGLEGPRPVEEVAPAPSSSAELAPSPSARPAPSPTSSATAVPQAKKPPKPPYRSKSLDPSQDSLGSSGSYDRK